MILNLLLFCENLKSKSSLNNESIVEYTDIDYSHNNTNTFKKIKTAINLAYFNGTNKLEVIEDEISLTLNKDYFKYVLDELNEIIEIFSIKYLDDELVLLEGLIKLFVVYLLQGLILFINNEKIGTIKNNNEENKILNEEIFDSDIGIIIREINNLGFDIESIEKGANKISADIFINSSKDSIVNSLENLKQSNYFIESYTINKNDSIHIKLKVKIS